MSTGVADHVQWGEMIIHYRYSFSSARTLAITVEPDLSVRVTAPTGTTPEVMRSKVLKRAPWIQRAWRSFEKFQPILPPRQYVPGETHRYLGRQYRLKLIEGPGLTVLLKRGYIEVTAALPLPTSEMKRHVQRWFRERAEVVLEQRLRSCHRRAAREGIPLPPLTLRRMKNRWGSCTKTKRILLNPDLVKVPTDCIDYVVFHELCHLVEHHHGPRFWRLLRRLLPDWKDRRAELNRMFEV